MLCSRRFLGIQFQHSRTEPGSSSTQQDEAGPSSVPTVRSSPLAVQHIGIPSSSGHHDPPVDPANDEMHIQDNLFQYL